MLKKWVKKNEDGVYPKNKKKRVDAKIAGPEKNKRTISPPTHKPLT